MADSRQILHGKEVQEEHLLNKEMARNLMKSDKNLAEIDTGVCVLNFDLQKVLNTPKVKIKGRVQICKRVKYANGKIVSYNIWHCTYLRSIYYLLLYIINF